ncbi:MAG: polymer-forming cytoskeletal protein [Myxococcales bacterium]|nr:polymer-forming cytoskeletal protein [Myxococcales bacterium]MDD9970690.1 polymer-forming cytoskeletal protein [Myxococcales bacterium]
MSGNNETADKQTTVEEGTQFKGTMSSKCPVVVRGELDGDITAPALTVADTGTVVGNVEARSIRSEGVLAGRVDAEDIYLSGSVRSDTVIRANTLEVKLKSDRGKLEVTFGDCILEVGDDPSVEAKKEPKLEAPKVAEDAPAQVEAGAGAVVEPVVEPVAEAASPEAKQDREPKKRKQRKSEDAAADESPNGKSASIPPPA